jgi:hypothetical protein
MAKLTDLQLVLLTTAASRDDGSLLPPAASVAAQAGRIAQAITTLIKRAFATETTVADAALGYRRNGDEQYGAVITDAGREVVGAPLAPADAGPAEANAAEPTSAAADEVQAPVATPAKSGTKQALLIGLLERDAGASLDELVTATGWLPHTTRAALTGLRKKGHLLDKAKVDEVTRYTIAKAA